MKAFQALLPETLFSSIRIRSTDSCPSLRVLRIQMAVGSAWTLTPNLLKGLQKVMPPENTASSQDFSWIKDSTTDFVDLLPFLSLTSSPWFSSFCAVSKTVWEQDFTLCMKFLPWLRSSRIVAQTTNETPPPTITNSRAKTELAHNTVLNYLPASQAVLVQLLVSGQIWGVGRGDAEQNNQSLEMKRLHS